MHVSLHLNPHEPLFSSPCLHGKDRMRTTAPGIDPRLRHAALLLGKKTHELWGFKFRRGGEFCDTFFPWYSTVDGWNPVNSPVEVGSLSHCLQDFIHPRCCRISAINGRCSLIFHSPKSITNMVPTTYLTILRIFGDLFGMVNENLTRTLEVVSTHMTSNDQEWIKRSLSGNLLQKSCWKIFLDEARGYSRGYSGFGWRQKFFSCFFCLKRKKKKWTVDLGKRNTNKFGLNKNLNLGKTRSWQFCEFGTFLGWWKRDLFKGCWWPLSRE